MNYENVLPELQEAADHLQVLADLAKASTLTEADYEVRLRHVLLHLYRGYNRRNLRTEESWGRNHEEYKALCTPPKELLDVIA